MEEQLAANPGEIAASQTSETTETTTAATEGAQTDVTQTQAFAHRLKEATADVERRTRDAVIAEMYSAQGITTYEQYQQALQQQEQERQAQEYGVDPRFYQKLSQSEQKVQTLEEKLNAIEREKVLIQQDSTLSSDPNLGEVYKQMKNDVRALADKAGTDLDIAFTLLLRDRIPTLLNGTKTQSEQETIKKLTQNAQSSPGSLSGGEVPHTTNVKNMSKDEFKKLEEAVLRGEVKTL